MGHLGRLQMYPSSPLTVKGHPICQLPIGRGLYLPLSVMVKDGKGVVFWRGPQVKAKGASPKLDVSCRARLRVGDTVWSVMRED